MMGLSSLQFRLNKLDKELDDFNAETNGAVGKALGRVTQVDAELIEAFNMEEYSPIALDCILRSTELACQVAEDITTRHTNLHRPISMVGKSITTNLRGLEPMQFSNWMPDVVGLNKMQKISRVNEVCRLISLYLHEIGSDDVINSLKNELDENYSCSCVEAYPLCEQEKQGEDRPIGLSSQTTKAILALEQNHDIEPSVELLDTFTSENAEESSQLIADLYFRKCLDDLREWETARADGILLPIKGFLSSIPDRYRAFISTKDMQWFGGAMLFGTKTLAYDHLYDPLHWRFLVCRLATVMNMQPTPLSLAEVVNTGRQTVQAVKTFCGKTDERSASSWLSGKELPVSVKCEKFHDVIVCPIIRDACSEKNLPIRLQCGHVISHQALSEIHLGAGMRKCPYCPRPFSIREVSPVFLRDWNSRADEETQANDVNPHYEY